jgi:heme exporter protein C
MPRRKINWYKYTSPASFYPLAGKLDPFFALLSTVLWVAGLYIGFFVAPTHAVQGEAYALSTLMFQRHGWLCFCMR